MHYQAAYWYLGHFSKYIRPGARRVLCSTSRDVLEVVSFLNLDSSLVVVVMNQSEDEINFWLKVPGSGAAFAEASPRSITTLIMDNSGEIAASPSIKRSRGCIQSRHGTYLKVTDGNPRNGPLVQTAQSPSGWETFLCIHNASEGFFCFRSFHGTWLSVRDAGEVATSMTLGEQERFFLELHKDGGYAVRTCRGRYLSVTPGVGERVLTVVGITGVCELFDKVC